MDEKKRAGSGKPPARPARSRTHHSPPREEDPLTGPELRASAGKHVSGGKSRGRPDYQALKKGQAGTGATREAGQTGSRSAASTGKPGSVDSSTESRGRPRHDAGTRPEHSPARSRPVNQARNSSRTREPASDRNPESGSPRKPVKAVTPQDASRDSSPRRLIEGRITGLNHEGDGMLYDGNLTVAVARTAPADLVRVSIPEDAERFVHGDLETLVHGGSARVNPPCPSFVAGCGGCQWMHLAIPVQNEEKTALVRNALAPVKGITVSPLLTMEKSREFRNKLSLENTQAGLVFMQDFNGRKISPPSCRAQTKALDMLWERLRELRLSRDVLQVHLRAGDAGGIGVCLHVKTVSPGVHQAAKAIKALGPAVVGVGALCKDSFQLLNGKAWVEHRTLGTRYRIPLAGFFQTNYSQARVLLQEALKLLAPQVNDRVLDLYCGGGFFSLPAARSCKEVMGIEANPASVDSARENAILNGLTNTCFVASDVAKALTGLEEGTWPLVMLDPPRSGCDEAVLKEVLRLKPRRIVYISCSPRSLGRDLEILCSGDYLPTWCQPVDMFPHTHHVETLVCLERKAE